MPWCTVAALCSQGSCTKIGRRVSHIFVTSRISCSVKRLEQCLINLSWCFSEISASMAVHRDGSPESSENAGAPCAHSTPDTNQHCCTHQLLLRAQEFQEQGRHSQLPLHSRGAFLQVLNPGWESPQLCRAVPSLPRAHRGKALSSQSLGNSCTPWSNNLAEPMPWWKACDSNPVSLTPTTAQAEALSSVNTAPWQGFGFALLRNEFCFSKQGKAAPALSQSQLKAHQCTNCSASLTSATHKCRKQKWLLGIFIEIKKKKIPEIILNETMKGWELD